MSEPLRDTETIRAARDWEHGEITLPDRLFELAAEVDRLVGRLQAAEQELAEYVTPLPYKAGYEAGKLAQAERVVALETALREVRQWFDNEPWKGGPDPGSFGGHPYSPSERAIGYGTYRDPRFLPPALSVSPAPTLTEVESAKAGMGAGLPAEDSGFVPDSSTSVSAVSPAPQEQQQR